MFDFVILGFENNIKLRDDIKVWRKFRECSFIIGGGGWVENGGLRKIDEVWGGSMKIIWLQ